MGDQAMAEAFGARLRGLRKARSMTQAVLAARIGRSVESVSNLERGMGLPAFGTLLSLADVLEVTLAELIAFEPGLSKDAQALLARICVATRSLGTRQIELVCTLAEELGHGRPRSGATWHHRGGEAGGTATRRRSPR